MDGAGIVKRRFESSRSESSAVFGLPEGLHYKDLANRLALFKNHLICRRGAGPSSLIKYELNPEVGAPLGAAPSAPHWLGGAGGGAGGAGTHTHE